MSGCKARRYCQLKTEKVPVSAVKSCAEELVEKCQCLSRHLEQLLKWTIIFLLPFHFLIELQQMQCNAEPSCAAECWGLLGSEI